MAKYFLRGSEAGVWSVVGVIDLGGGLRIQHSEHGIIAEDLREKAQVVADRIGASREEVRTAVRGTHIGIGE